MIKQAFYYVSVTLILILILILYDTMVNFLIRTGIGFTLLQTLVNCGTMAYSLFAPDKVPKLGIMCRVFNGRKALFCLPCK